MCKVNVGNPKTEEKSTNVFAESPPDLICDRCLGIESMNKAAEAFEDIRRDKLITTFSEITSRFCLWRLTGCKNKSDKDSDKDQIRWRAPGYTYPHPDKMQNSTDDKTEQLFLFVSCTLLVENG